MSDRFIKFIPSEEALWLMSKHPFAYLLLNLIATRARRISGLADGLGVGECYIGDHESIGATRGQYRHALKVLLTRKYLTILETCRTRQKTTTGTTTVGTKVKLIRSDVWDVNFEDNNHRNNHPATTEQPPNNHEQERIRTNKKEKDIKESIQTIEVARPMLDIRSILLHEKKEEQIEGFRRYTAEKGIEFTLKDIRGWFKVYEADYIVSIYELLLKEIDLVRTKKDKDPIRNPAAWMQNALDKNFIAANMLAEYNKEYAFHMQKNGWLNLKILTRYACDNTTGKDFIFSDPNCKIIMEREYERVMGA